MPKQLKDLTPDELAKRNEYRNHLLGSPCVRQLETVEWNGKMYDVCAPSMAQQRRLENASSGKDGKKDNIKSLCVALVECVLIHGTDIQVFEASDVAIMEERTMQDFVGAFAKALVRLSQSATPEEVEKN